ncbi:MAG: ABC transporter ATP-binding protein [Pseudomonadota bacterium]
MPPFPPGGPAEGTGVCLQGVTLRRGANTVLENISLDLQEPRIGVIGDNGAGKSSLFRLICGLDVPQAGRVAVCGQDMREGAARALRVGMMFQNPDEQIVFPTVEEELALSLTAGGRPRGPAIVQAREWLHTRGLGHWAARAVSGLSQGQRQHVCWLALLIAAPRVLLLDEPFASLDLPGQTLLHQDIEQAAQQVIVATHQLDHVRGFARVLWLDHGKVRIDGAGAQVCAAYEADVATRWAHRLAARDPAGRA